MHTQLCTAIMQCACVSVCVCVCVCVCIDWPLEKYATLAAGDALTLGQTNYLEWATVHFPHFPCTLMSDGVVEKTGRLKPRWCSVRTPRKNFAHKYSLFSLLNPRPVVGNLNVPGNSLDDSVKMKVHQRMEKFRFHSWHSLIRSALLWSR